MADGGGIQHLAQLFQRRLVGTEISVLDAHALRHERDTVEQAERRRLGGEWPQQWLCVQQRIEQLGQVLPGKQQEALMSEERVGIRSGDVAEMGLISLQRRCQFVGGSVSFLGGGAVYHRDQHVVELRELAIHRQFLLPPRQAAGKHVIGIRIDAQMAVGKPDANNGKQGKNQCDQPRVAPAGIDKMCNPLGHW